MDKKRRTRRTVVVHHCHSGQRRARPEKDFVFEVLLPGAVKLTGAALFLSGALVIGAVNLTLAAVITVVSAVVDG